MAPIAPARSGYAVRCRTIVDALMTMADTRALVLLGQADEGVGDRTAELYPADIVRAPHMPKALRAATHGYAALRGRNRWLEKFAHGRALREARAALTRFDPDVVVLAHSALASLIAPFGIPWGRLILDHHNLETVNYARMAAVRRGPSKLIPMIDARTFRALETACGQAADRWAVSTPDAAALAHLQGAPVRVVPNVAPQHCFELEPAGTAQGAPPVLGFLGNYHYQPNIDAALAVCDVSAALKQRGVAHEAIIMGRDPTPEMRSRAAATNVTLTGFVEDATPYLTRFTLQLAPINAGSGTKLKIVESLAMGVPVVTTPIGAEGLPIADANIGLVADSTDGLADACKSLLDDRESLENMGKRAREWARSNVSMAALIDAVRSSLAVVATRLPPQGVQRVAR